VNPATIPQISGASTACAGSTVSYLTQAGMTNYVWTVSPGGTITSGQGTKQVYVQWTTPGQQTIAVTFTTTTGCPVLNPTIKTVNVFPIPTPTITGPTTSCVGTLQTYSTEPGMTNYQWTLGGSGGIIYSGFGTSQILAEWTAAGAKTVSVFYVNSGGCYTTNPPVLNVTVNTCPSKPGNSNPGPPESIDFTVYPNPNEGLFSALINSAVESAFTIEMYDLTGVMIYRSDEFIAKGRISRLLDIQSLPSGIYSVILRGNDQVLVRKVVINK